MEPNERKEKVSHENEEEGRQFFIINLIKDFRFLSFFLYFSRCFLSFSLLFKRERRREKERREWNEADADSAAGVMRMMRKLIRAWYWFNWTREIFFLLSFSLLLFLLFLSSFFHPFSFSFMNRKNRKEKNRERERKEKRDRKKLHLDFFFSR